MTSFRRLAVGFIGVSLALAGGATAWLAAADPAVASTAQVQPRIQPNGVNFVLHSIVDPNFCMEDTPAPDNPASGASMSQCAVRDGQEWTFAHAADGSVVIVGGNTGNCLDFSAAIHSPPAMAPCTFAAAEHFSYSPKGQIKSTSGTKCLQAAAASQNAQMLIAKCKKGVALQVFQLSH